MRNPTSPDAEAQTHAQWTIRFSPWLLCAAVLMGSISVTYGIAPASFLLANLGLGIAWFALLALPWRVGSDALRTVVLLFVIFAQQATWYRLGGGQVFAIMQGGSVLFSAAFALMFFSRRWLSKSARLEDVGKDPASHPGNRP